MNDAERQELMSALGRLWSGWSDLRFGQMLEVAVKDEDVRHLGGLDDRDLLAGVLAAVREAPGRPPPAGPYWDTETRGGRTFLNGRPRDPARIGAVLDALSAASCARPGMTIGQVVELALDRGGVSENEFRSRVLLIEDGQLRRLLLDLSADADE